MATLPIEILKHRESFSFAEAAFVFGHSAGYYRDLFQKGVIAGYDAGGITKKRVRLYASSIRAHFDSLRINTAPAPAPVKKMTARQWALSHGCR